MWNCTLFHHHQPILRLTTGHGSFIGIKFSFSSQCWLNANWGLPTVFKGCHRHHHLQYTSHYSQQVNTKTVCDIIARAFPWRRKITDHCILHSVANGALFLLDQCVILEHLVYQNQTIIQYTECEVPIMISALNLIYFHKRWVVYTVCNI